jgi:hypothetical protein
VVPNTWPDVGTKFARRVRGRSCTRSLRAGAGAAGPRAMANSPHPPGFYGPPSLKLKVQDGESRAHYSYASPDAGSGDVSLQLSTIYHSHRVVVPNFCAMYVDKAQHLHSVRYALLWILKDAKNCCVVMDRPPAALTPGCHNVNKKCLASELLAGQSLKPKCPTHIRSGLHRLSTVVLRMRGHVRPGAPGDGPCRRISVPFLIKGNLSLCKVHR